MKQEENLSTLVIHRFCGEENYPIKRAECYIIEGDNTEDDRSTLWLEVDCTIGSKLHDDTKSLNANPNWEVSFSNITLTKKDLIKGLHMENANDDQDSEAILYYCEHQPTIDNKMEILEVTDNMLLIQLYGETTDVNFYDGSKPLNKLYLNAWFTFKK